MPRTDEQFQMMRDKSKHHIMDIALKLFATQGYHSTSIQKIAKEAGIATGLVYNYFESKEHLLNEIVTTAFSEIMELLFTSAKAEIENVDLTGLIDKLFEVVKAKKDSWQLYITTLLQPEVADIGRKNVNHLTFGLDQISEAYFRKAGRTDAENRAKALGAIIHGAIIGYILDKNDATLELVKQLIITDIIQK